MDLTRRKFLGLAGIAAAGPFVIKQRVADAAVDPAVVGAWGPRVKLPNVAIHMSTIPNTSYTWMSFTRWQTRGCKAWVYDWNLSQYLDASMLNTDYDFMCGGGALDDRGRLRLYGGRAAANQTTMFDPVKYAALGSAGAYVKGPMLNNQAYYCSALRVGPVPGYPTGAILIGYGKRTYMEIYNPHDYSIAKVTKLPKSADLPTIGAQVQFYPKLMGVPDGRLVLVGPEKPLQYLDMNNYKWNSLGVMVKDRRYEAGSTRLPGSGFEFLMTGGDPIGSSKTQERINLLDGTPKSRPAASMTFQRRQLNTVLLPDGTVLIMGGMGTTAGQPAGNAPELYDPATDTCCTMKTLLMPDTPGGADKPSYRAYHSTSTLLDDGSVIWAGGVAGVNGWSFERYFPGYLYRGDRPTFTLDPVNVEAGYGALIPFSTTTNDITRVVLMRPEHVSHGYDAGQTHIECQILTFPDLVQAVMPTNRNLAPAGWYRAFALNAAGVPSHCQWIRLT